MRSGEWRKSVFHSCLLTPNSYLVMEKDYFVPFADYGEDKFEEKRSKFTGRLWHVETAEEAVAKIKEMRETYWDATHNCYAYILREGNVMRYSDDGEPQGTAGMPILEVLRHENLTDCVCVVTRYFGGILLGTGGLVRAYQEAVKAGLAASKIIVKQKGKRLAVETDYTGLGRLQYLFASENIIIEETEYTELVTIHAVIPADNKESVIKKITEATNGSARTEWGEDIVFAECDGQIVIF